MIKIDINEKNEIIEEIINKNNLSKKQEIDYSEFLHLYEDYKDKFTQTDFAKLLGIKEKSFFDFKSRAKNNKETKICILANRQITIEEKQKVIIRLLNKYKLKKGKKIDYKLFKLMHDEVKDILTEYEFAELLQISPTNVRNIRREGTARIFRKMSLDEHVTEKIRLNIVNNYEGKKIYYRYNKIENKGKVDFLKLYEPYRLYFTENEFARILGISGKNIWYASKMQANPRILDIKKVKNTEKIKNKIAENRFYNKNEIEEICEKNDLTTNDFITYFINKGKFFDSTIYNKALENNEGLYIGKDKISDKTSNQFNVVFERIVKTVVNSVQKKYGQYYLEDDLKSEILFYVVYNCNDLVQNFKYDEKLMERMIWLRARKFAQIRFIDDYKKEIKNIALNDRNIVDKEEKFNIIESDKGIIKEQIQELDIENKEELIELFKLYLSQGYSKEEILEDVSKTYGIEKEEMLEMMKSYLLENKKVVKNDKGEYQLGEI